MYDYTGRLVCAQAGRDKDGLFCVIGTKDSMLLLADGKRRRASKPKQKKLRHVRVLSQAEFDHPAIEKLKQGKPVSDRELRRALAAVQGGNQAWRKTI
jgi:ribosomal protein L14E/L6E/L27E